MREPKLKVCKLCGQLFEANGKTAYCSATHYARCEYCGEEFEISNVHYPSRTCSNKCRSSLRKEHAEATSLKLYGVKNAGGTEESKKKVNATCRAKYGVDWAGQSDIQKQHVKETFEAHGGNPMQRQECKDKVKKTCQIKYGATNVLCKDSTLREYVRKQAYDKYGTTDPGNLPEFREKARQTSIKHWGTEYYRQSEQGKEAVKQTCLERYGGTSPFASSLVKDKSRQTCLERYGVEVVSQSPEVIEKMSQTIMERYGVPYFCMHPKCMGAQNMQPSKLNIAFGEKLKELGVDCIEYEHRIGRFSYDICVDSHKTLIEIDPTYTHTAAATKLGNKRVSYHKEKTQVAEANGYRCIHVFDWDDWSKILDMFKSKQVIYARKCSIQKLSDAECSSFLNQFHLQGNCKGQKVLLGLYFEGKLIQVMTFGQPRYNSKFEWELIRLCTDSNYQVVGGAQKLFSHALEILSPHSIVSYCDKSKFSGDVYTNLGFECADEGDPSKHWSKSTKHITDNLLRQRGYDQLFGTDFGKGTSNELLMLDHGWLPVYDCGQARFEWKEQGYETNL